jgi:hypothetical protein
MKIVKNEKNSNVKQDQTRDKSPKVLDNTPNPRGRIGHQIDPDGDES